MEDFPEPLQLALACFKFLASGVIVHQRTASAISTDSNCYPIVVLHCFPTELSTQRSRNLLDFTLSPQVRCFLPKPIEVQDGYVLLIYGMYRCVSTSEGGFLAPSSTRWLASLAQWFRNRNRNGVQQRVSQGNTSFQRACQMKTQRWHMKQLHITKGLVVIGCEGLMEPCSRPTSSFMWWHFTPPCNNT